MENINLMLLEARTCSFYIGMESGACLVDPIGLLPGNERR